LGVSRPARRRAFSLVELTVVLVIIAAIAGMAYPRYASSLSHYRVDLCARRFAADLALAQAASRSTGKFQTITITPATDRYRLDDQATATTAGARYIVAFNTDPYYTSLRSAKDPGGSDVTILKFDGFGNPSTGLNALLVCGDHWRRVTVDASSGAINVVSP
jgi:prepilin-type N-terminal cleavage/methylation domain-containing protein